MEHAEWTVACEVGTQAQHIVHDHRLHMTVEQQELVQAAHREMEVGRNRWSTEFQLQRDCMR